MNVVYLIGNGFDLSLKLDTGAESFIRSFKDKFSQDIDERVVALVEDMNREGIKTWADFEKESGAYSARYAEIFGDDAAGYVETCSRLFDYLHQMLTIEQARISKEYIEENSLNCMQSLFAFKNEAEAGEKALIESLRQKHSNEHWEYRLLNFNYTNTVDRFVASYKSSNNEILGSVVPGSNPKHVLKDVIHVHHDLNNPIVCGLDDVDQISYEPFRTSDDVLEVLVKQSCQRFLRRTDDEQGFHAIRDAHIICIYGMSLGPTDRRWWKAVLKRINEDPKTLLILMSHSIGSIEAHTVFMKRKLIKEERNRLFDSADLLDEEERKRLSENIIVIPSTNILTITNPIECE